jgi:hypothetical protein
MGLPLDLEFRTKGQLAIDLAGRALADGITFDFFCGDVTDRPSERPPRPASLVLAA